MKRNLLHLLCSVFILSILSDKICAEQHSAFNSERVKFWSELKSLNFGDLLNIPEVDIPAISLVEADLPSELRTEDGYDAVKKLFELSDQEEYDRAYIQCDLFLTKNQKSPFYEWVEIFKADMLFKVREKKEPKRYNMVLEEYQDVLRKYPLNLQAPRIIYQMGVLQLRMELFSEVNSTVARGLREYEKSSYAPYYRLLDAEQAFLSKDDLKASFDYSMVIQKHPKHRVAVDSAFRKAFILFRKGDYKGALKVYDDLDKYHSDEMDRLKLKVEPSSTDKFLDRVYYAETVYLNERYAEAAKLFQDLGNLFPGHFASPYLLLRLGDTYLWRGQIRAAKELYSDVLARSGKAPLVGASAKLRLADLYFLSGDMEASDLGERLYEEAFETSKKSDRPNLSALALARFAAHHIYFKTYPKAQSALRYYRENFKDTPNQAWADAKLTELVELEIYDHYDREDYLAALSAYLMFERDQSNRFQNTRVLLKIADAARKLFLNEKAAQILNRVIYLEKTSEGRQEALLRLIDILISQGELRKASERLRRFNFAYPATSLRYLYEMYWGDLYAALKNNEQAKLHYEKAIQAAHNDPAKLFEIRHVYLRLAEEYGKLLLPLKSIESYERFAKLVKESERSPLSTQVLTKQDRFLFKFSKYRIADSYFNMHDYVKALDAYRAVTEEIKEEPFLSHAFYRIGECYLALDDRKAAVNAFKAIPTKDPSNIWARAAKSYIASVEMEVKYGIRIFN